MMHISGLHHQGIFRVSGSQVEINNFRESFERGEDPLADVTDASDINSVAGVLKLYLRELREPLFPIIYFEHFMELAREYFYLCVELIFFFLVQPYGTTSLLLLLLALQPTVGINLLSNFLPFCPFLTQLSPPSYPHYLYIFFDVLNPSFPWSSSVSPTYWFPL